MAKKRYKKGEIVFRKIKGRIVPIAVTGAGIGLAAGAARTKRIYANKALTVDVKRFTLQPFQFGIGSKITMRKAGKRIGNVYFGRSKILDKTYNISWLGVKKAYRGKGFGKKLAKFAAIEAKRKGAKSLYQQVVHRRSLNMGYNRKRDTLFRMFTRKDTGYAYHTQVTKKEALRNIVIHAEKGYKGSDIFRETSLKGLKTRGKGFIKPFRPLRSKAGIALGTGIALAGAGTALFKKEKR